MEGRRSARTAREGGERLSIVVSGMIAAVPDQGGATWAVLQYLLGLKELGHRVFFLEQLDADAVRPPGAPLSESRNADYFGEVMAAHELDRSATLLLAGTRQTVGAPYASLERVAREAEVLLNISGTLTDEALLAAIPLRAYIDLDPAFNQLWHASGIDMRFEGHTHFVTVGQAIGEPDCPVPTGGRSWTPTLPPVVLAQWPRAGVITVPALTTVGNWRGYGSIEQDGVHYGQKAHALRPLISLPRQTGARFLLALAIHPQEKRDLDALDEHGWELADAAAVAGSPERYREFIQGSWAEFGLAKSGYVVSRCGWFSDRSACYLASGRPVIAQDTGFARFLPTGTGLFAFQTADDVLAAIDELRTDYARHSSAARSLAEEHFDSRRVLAELLQKLGATS